MTHAHEQTLAIIKPDMVGSNCIGSVIEVIEKDGLILVGALMIQLKKEDVEEFYAIHKERSFFGDLIKFMTSEPVLVLALEGKDAVSVYRKIMGDTDPSKAKPGTIRAEFCSSIDANGVHGSDSIENAAKEIAFFKKRGLIICPRNHCN